ncbi:MAG: hypothetical protein MK207_05815 [Saprospiraceae bacterium]|nr:hypothetical protein [Saprospiraceae bacterium]
MLRNISYIFVGIILIVGLLFKFMYWPYGRELLIGALSGIAIILLGFSIDNRKSKILTRNFIYPLLGIIYVLGLLFKIMELPSADLMLIISIIGLSFALVEFAFSIRKSVHVLLPLFFSITMFFILFRILHWTEPPYVLYGFYFTFSIIVPIVLFSMGFKLKKSNSSLSNHLLFLSTLSFVLFIIEALNKATQMGKIDLISLNHIMLIDVLLFSSLILAISKTQQIENFKLQFNNNYQILKCLKGIYIFILMLMVLVST